MQRQRLARQVQYILNAQRRWHSVGSDPTFLPKGSTSADTAITYGEPHLTSAAYLPRSDGTVQYNEATTQTAKNLTPAQRKAIEEIIRVDQAGELGANYIYLGQVAAMKVLGDQKITDLIQTMYEGEMKHIAVFDRLANQHEVRPTSMYPLWKVGSFALGFGTAIFGKRAAMACTEAVETVIGEHYNDQIKQLDEPGFKDKHESLALLRDILEEFRDDELGHLDTAIENESQQAPAYALLSSVIAATCRTAIEVSKRL